MTNTIKKRRTVLLCLLIGLLLRIIYIIKYPIQPRDTFLYINIIEKWENEGVIENEIGIVPLSLWIFKITHMTFSIDLLKSGVLINMIFGLLIIVVMIKITEILFHSELIQLFVGLITAAHPVLIHFSCVFLRENSYLFFSSLALLCLIRNYVSSRYLLISCGSVASALSFACRLEGLELPLFFFLAIIYGNRGRKQLYKRIPYLMLLYVLIYIFTLLSLLYIMNINSDNINYINKRMKARTLEKVI